MRPAKSLDPCPLEVMERFGDLRRQVNLLVMQKLRTAGLGPKQAVILRYLTRSGSATHPVSMTELSRGTATDPAALGKATGQLIKKGWVSRVCDPKDRRRFEVRLSPQGTKLAKGLEQPFGILCEQVLKPLSTEERNEFHRLLGKVLSGLKT